MPSITSGRAISLFARLGVELIGELLAPTRCASCDERVPMRTVFCPPCAATAVRAAPTPAEGLAAFTYGGAIARAVVRFKYEGRPDLARPLPRGQCRL